MSTFIILQQHIIYAFVYMIGTHAKVILIVYLKMADTCCTRLIKLIKIINLLIVVLTDSYS
jgi:hypothetical protein